MARIFTDGAEMGDLLFWSTTTSWLELDASIKRSGSYSYHLIGNQAQQRNITGISEGYFRICIRLENVSSSATVFTWRNSTTTLGSLRVSTSGRIELYTSTGTLVDTGSISLSVSTWYMIELHVKIDDSPNGALEVKIDGVADASFTGGDTKPGAATTFDNFQINCGGVSSDIWFDDLAMNDTTGGTDNSWCGDGKIIFLTPDADGDNSEFTNSSGTSTNNYLFVDDIPSDSDISYVQASNSGTLDLYNLSACGLTDVTITRVWAEARAKDTVAEGGQIFLAIKTEATEYDSSAISLLTSYTQCLGTDHTVNPNTSLAWTTTQLDALQVGPKVI